jgi:hypothetical protein
MHARDLPVKLNGGPIKPIPKKPQLAHRLAPQTSGYSPELPRIAWDCYHERVPEWLLSESDTTVATNTAYGELAQT